MKFNFEKAKDIIKKTAIGAGVVASSLGNLEAQEVKTNSKEKDISKNEIVSDNKNLKITKDQNEKLRLEKIKEIEKELGVLKENNDINDAEFYRNEYLKYMEHPSYKVRLAKEMYGDQIIDEEKQRQINYEYKKRLDQINKVSIEIDNKFDPLSQNTPKFSVKDNLIQSNIKGVFHEFSHTAEGDRYTSSGFDKKMREFKTQGDLANRKKILESEKTNALNKIMTKEVYEINHNEYLTVLRKYIEDNKNSEEFQTEKVYKLYKKINDIYESMNVGVKNYFSCFDLQNPNPKFIASVSEDKQSFTMEEDLFNLKKSISSDQTDFINKNEEILKKLISYERQSNAYDKKIRPIISSLLYLKSGTEVRARLNHLRMLAIEKYNFDLNTDFNINEFEKLKDDPQYIDLKNNLGYSDEQINELMKYTAENKNTNEKDKTYYHPSWDSYDTNNKA